LALDNRDVKWNTETYGSVVDIEQMVMESEPGRRRRWSEEV
jgi:hypothetical protein